MQRAVQWNGGRDCHAAADSCRRDSQRECAAINCSTNHFEGGRPSSWVIASWSWINPSATRLHRSASARWPRASCSRARSASNCAFSSIWRLLVAGGSLVFIAELHSPEVVAMAVPPGRPFAYVGGITRPRCRLVNYSPILRERDVSVAQSIGRSSSPSREQIRRLESAPGTNRPPHRGISWTVFYPSYLRRRGVSAIALAQCLRMAPVGRHRIRCPMFTALRQEAG